MARITYRQIEAFRAVMISGTTSGAADILCISQPAVSRLLADFESAVAVKMFERQKKRLIPTPEAHVFYAEVERSFISLETLARAADDLKECHIGSLRVASMPALSVDFIPGVIQAFSQLHAGVSFSFQVRSTQQVADLVASQQYDLGVVSAIPMTDSAIEVETLAESCLVCILPKDHPLVAKDEIVPSDLEGENFISLGTEQGLLQKIDSVFDSAGVNRKLLMDTQLSYSACAMVLAGAGVALVEPITALHYQKLGLVIKPFSPCIRYRYNLIFPAHKVRSDLTKAFVKLLRQELDVLAKSPVGLFAGLNS